MTRIVVFVDDDNGGACKTAAERTEAGVDERRRRGHALEPAEPYDGGRSGGDRGCDSGRDGIACGETVDKGAVAADEEWADALTHYAIDTLV